MIIPLVKYDRRHGQALGEDHRGRSAVHAASPMGAFAVVGDEIGVQVGLHPVDALTEPGPPHDAEVRVEQSVWCRRSTKPLDCGLRTLVVRCPMSSSCGNGSGSARSAPVKFLGKSLGKANPLRAFCARVVSVHIFDFLRFVAKPWNQRKGAASG
jgi:hypothetical protein